MADETIELESLRSKSPWKFGRRSSALPQRTKFQFPILSNAPWLSF